MRAKFQMGIIFGILKCWCRTTTYFKAQNLGFKISGRTAPARQYCKSYGHLKFCTDSSVRQAFRNSQKTAWRTKVRFHRKIKVVKKIAAVESKVVKRNVSHLRDEPGLEGEKISASPSDER